MLPPLSPLKEFELLDITGKDATQFLQGQLTCDVKNMQSSQFYLGAVCNPKGQMLANFVITTLTDGFRLRLVAGQGQHLMDALKKYNVFFKANMQLRPDLQVFASVPKTLKTFNLEHFELHTDQSCDHQTLYWSDGRIERWQEATGVTNQHIFHCWQFADIQAGIYWLSQAEKEQWLPQVIHWQTLKGVSFTKGCYTGQEVIARLQHLGKSKKVLARIHSKEPLSAGDALFDEKKNVVAQVLNYENELGLTIINKAASQLFTASDCLVTQVYDEFIMPPHT